MYFAMNKLIGCIQEFCAFLYLGKLNLDKMEYEIYNLTLKLNYIIASLLKTFKLDIYRLDI